MISYKRRHVRLARVVSIVVMVIALPGCHSAKRTNHLDAAFVLDQAGDAIAGAEYVEAVVEYRRRGRQQREDTIEECTMLFGPDRSIRVEREDDFVFYDGRYAGVWDPKGEEVLTSEQPKKYAHAVMIVGMFMGGVTLALPAARDIGRQWWRELYQEDAALELRGSEVVDGTECHVIVVRPKRGDSEVVWWVTRQGYRFKRVEAMEKKQPQSRVFTAEYKVLRFPEKIERERFADPLPRKYDSEREAIGRE